MCSKVGGCVVRFCGFRGCAAIRRVCSKSEGVQQRVKRVCSKGSVAEILECVQQGLEGAQRGSEGV